MYSEPVPIARTMPMPEANAPGSGDANTVSPSDHKHQRMAAVTVPLTVDANNEFRADFAIAFAVPPGLSWSYAETADNPPITFKVKQWVRDGVVGGTTGPYTGAVCKAFRGVVLPSSILTLLSLVNYNVFGGSAVGIPVTVIAVTQSATTP